MPDLAEYPIVVLENDAPEAVGKLGLFDLRMPVGSTGLVFIAAVPGILYPDGPKFTELVQRFANLRAATTLVQMGLISGASLGFIREALRLSYQEVADGSGVAVSTVVGWENNTIRLPYNVFASVAQRACLADGRAMPAHHALCPDWRPREIRVFPNIPVRGAVQSSQSNNLAPLYPLPFPSYVPGAECYPPPCC